MNGRFTLGLLLAVSLLGGYIYFADRHRDNSEQRRLAARLAFRINPEEVTGIRIDTPAGRFAVTLTNEQWRLIHPVSAAADGNAVMRILDAIAAARWSQSISAAEQRALPLTAEQFGFNPPRATLVMETATSAITLSIGRDAPGGQHVYVQRADTPEVFVVARGLLNALPVNAIDLRDRRLIGIPPGRVRRLEWQSPDAMLQLVRGDGDGWYIERPVRSRAAETAVRQWLHRLYEFRIHDFVAESVAAGSLYGFDHPERQLTLTGDPGHPSYVLKIGHAIEGEEGLYYATVAGQDHVFSVGDDVVEWLSPELRVFRDHQVLAIAPGEIDGFTMQSGEWRLVANRGTQGVWEVTAPKRFQAHEPRIQTLLSAWTDVLVSRFIDPPITDYEPFGLHITNRIITFRRSDSAAAEREWRFVLGGANEQGDLYIAAPVSGQVMEVPGRLATTFSIDPLDYRDPVILTLEPESVQRITQRGPWRERVVERQTHFFRPTDSTFAPDTDAIDLVLFHAAQLVAVRFIEEDPPDLTRYGLSPPRRQIIFGLSAGINRVLLIGDDANDDEFYAMRQGTDIVFTLARAAVEALLKPVANPIAPILPIAPGEQD
ncbi:MAG TPA: DUF4340 domain-containing protein [Kiritimatiellia bacterium]|nr:DUF4340 domain-containing protein [Kiritimatiellia bacterium]